MKISPRLTRLLVLNLDRLQQLLLSPNLQALQKLPDRPPPMLPRLPVLLEPPAAISNAVPTSGDDVKEQLAAARAQIAKLTAQAQDPQVRQRKVQEASDKMQTVVQQSQEGGVPLQIVAGSVSC